MHARVPAYVRVHVYDGYKTCDYPCANTIFNVYTGWCISEHSFSCTRLQGSQSSLCNRDVPHVQHVDMTS